MQRLLLTGLAAIALSTAVQATVAPAQARSDRFEAERRESVNKLNERFDREHQRNLDSKLSDRFGREYQRNLDSKLSDRFDIERQQTQDSSDK